MAQLTAEFGLVQARSGCLHRAVYGKQCLGCKRRFSRVRRRDHHGIATGVTFICSADMHDLEPIHGVAGRRRPLRPRHRVLKTTSQTARVAPRGPPTLCCAIMLQGRKSGFRGSRGRRASQGVRPSQSLPGPKASSQGIAPQGFSGHGEHANVIWFFKLGANSDNRNLT